MKDSPGQGPTWPLMRATASSSRSRGLRTVAGLAALVAVLFLLAIAGCGGEKEAGPGIVVDSTEDLDQRDGVLTLREAMLVATGGLAEADLDPDEADNVGGRPGAASGDTITFDASVFAAPQGGTISLTSPLPPLATGSDAIDGTEVTVTIEGADLSSECFIIDSGENAIRGLGIQNCLAAVMIKPGAQGNLIGGSSEGQGNVISANYEGIVIGGAGAEGNVIKGNLIGVDASGATALANHNGIHIHEEAQGNVIGGSSPGDRNIIGGSQGVGVLIRGRANVVQGNYIGTDATGTVAVANAMEGVWIADRAQENLIGGSAEGEGNLISGNDLFGVSIAGIGADNNVLQGNYMGLDATGSTPLPNAYAVAIYRGAQNNIIGGSEPGEGNVISGNGTGIIMRDRETTANVIIGNILGMDADKEEAMPNSRGIRLQGGVHHNTIGGTGPGEGNVIAGNRGVGVHIEDEDTVGNTIRGNAIYANLMTGIQIMDRSDGEPKAPTITSTSPVAGRACVGCTIDIYSDSDGQGEFYEGSTVADADGRFTFEGNVRGPNVTATATDSEGNTSVFSESFAIASR